MSNRHDNDRKKHAVYPMAPMSSLKAKAHAALHGHVVEAEADQQLLAVEQADLRAVLQHVGCLHCDHLFRV